MVVKSYSFSWCKSKYGQRLEIFVQDGKKWCGCVDINTKALATIANLMVHPKHLRRGYGRVLMQRLIAEFGNQTLMLEVEPDTNVISAKALTKFYHSLGFKGTPSPNTRMMMVRDKTTLKGK